jgi:putative acetyltransferase
MHLTLRPATNRDRGAIETLVFGVLAEYGLKSDPSGTDSDLQDIERSYLASGGMFDVLTDEAGQVVGSVGLLPLSGPVCELRKMYLAAPARGLGHGRRLLDHALSRARELGFARVVLETASVLREAVALYERYGFRRYTPEHLAARCDTAYFLDLSAGG